MLGEEYTLVSIEYSGNSPEFKTLEKCHGRKCDKDAKFRCSECKRSYYCSRKCQKDEWGVHKFFCGSDDIIRVTLKDKNGYEKIIDASGGGRYEKQYFNGWIQFDEVKDVKHDTTIFPRVEIKYI